MSNQDAPKDARVTRKPTPMGFVATEKYIENVSVKRAGTESSFIQENVREKPLPIVYESPSTHMPRTRPARLAVLFDRMFPPYKRYCFRRLNRRQFLIALGVMITLLLALIIGLAAGLSRPSNKFQNLPLPSSSETFTGDLTYYDPGLGACGITSSSSDNIVAVSRLLFDAEQQGSNPNANPLCNRKIRATRFNEEVGEQRSVDLTVVDRCVGCAATDIDVTISAFTQLGDQDKGRISVSWAWL